MDCSRFHGHPWLLCGLNQNFWLKLFRSTLRMLEDLQAVVVWLTVVNGSHNHWPPYILKPSRLTTLRHHRGKVRLIHGRISVKISLSTSAVFCWCSATSPAKFAVQKWKSRFHLQFEKTFSMKFSMKTFHEKLFNWLRHKFEQFH